MEKVIILLDMSENWFYNLIEPSQFYWQSEGTVLVEERGDKCL